MKKLSKIFRWMIYGWPAVLFFSYEPLIHFGASESMNFELSIPLIWLVIFDAISFVLMIQKKVLFRDFGKKWVWLLFPLWLSFSVLWSLNSIRGLLTVGILWLIYFAGYSIWQLRDLLKEVGYKEMFWKVFFGSSIVVCGWCVIQCILDLVGVSREYSLICAGCTYHMFGFPHPDGFAIEPQFMGNLLIAPMLVMVWLIISGFDGTSRTRVDSPCRHRGNRANSRAAALRNVLEVPSSTTNNQNNTSRTQATSSSHHEKKCSNSRAAALRNVLEVPFLITSYRDNNLRNVLEVLFLIVVSSTLFLTFSRGAIYAGVIGLLVMSGWVLIQEKKQRGRVLKRIGMVWGAVLFSFLFALNLQGVMAQVSPTSDTYKTGVSKVLNHLTLGVIDIDDNSPVEAVKSNDEAIKREDYREQKSGNDREEVVENSVENSEVEEAVFDGYVAESTDTRLRLSRAGLSVWKQDLTTMMFGVGLGGAGQALYNNGLSPAPKEIVQNQYVSLLLETGIVGISLLIVTIVLVMREVLKTKKKIMITSLLVAYAVSVCFFSGLPNALHIYILPILFTVL